MYRKNKIKAIIALIIALTFVLPSAAVFTNIETDLENNIEETVVDFGTIVTTRDVIWEYSNGLDWPMDADRLENNNTLITDYGNNRIIEVASNGSIVWEYSNGLSGPKDADRLENNNTLITDRYNHRIIEVTPDKNIIWEYGIFPDLYYPEDADRLENNNTLISDSYNNRIIEVASNGSIVWEYSTWPDLDSPEDADRLENNNTLISDSGHKRIIEITSDGSIIWEYSTDIGGPWDAYPREADRLENNNTLIADTGNNRIIEVTSDGDIIWEYNTGLDWPCDADYLENGNILITDCDNNRIIEVNISSEYTLTVNIEGSGTVAIDPDQATYQEGTVINLIANANPGWNFSYWTGNLTGSDNPTNITMDSDKIVTAHFHTDSGISPLDEEWNRTFGGTRYERGRSVQQTTDGGYIILGNTESFGNGDEDFYLVKTDVDGNMTWDRTFGGTDWDWGYSVQQTTDGGYILVGSTKSYGAGGFDCWLIKTDANGNKIWDRTFGTRFADYGYSVQQTTDGGYIIAGRTNSFSDEFIDYDSWLIKTNAYGNMIWNRTYGFSGWNLEETYSVKQTTDGGYILVGTTCNFETIDFNLWVVKTGATGNKIWDRTLGGKNSKEWGYSVQQTTDGGYILTGSKGVTIPLHSYDVWLIKLDKNGDMEWDKLFGGIDKDWGYSVQQTTDEGYIIAGSTKSYGAGDADCWLIKTDENGNMIWDKTIGGSNEEWGYSIQQTTDEGYIIAGSTESYGAGRLDFWLIKMEADSAGMIYVDDDADPDWYDAIHVRTIQEGVNNATAGDTIFVYNGTYDIYDEIIVNKSVDLIGESKENVIIDSHETTTDSFAIKVVVDYVNITTFSMTAEWSCIRLQASYATIANCNLDAPGWAGIELLGSDNNIITDCTIHNFARGIEVESGSNNLIYLNIFKNTSYVHAIDNGANNMWDNGILGNYWDDYTGRDEDGDGIGDEPYTIPGSAGSQDRYPLMNPTDMTPPVTTCELEGDMEGDVYLGKVTVTLLAKDVLSGVNYTNYKIDDGNWMNYTEPFIISDNSNHTLYFYSVDNVGNVEEIKQCAFTIKCIMVDIKGGLGITITFDNIGEADITGLEYTVILDGLILIPLGGTKDGTVDVPVGEIQIKIPVLGLGRSDVTVTAGPTEGTTDAWILLFLVLIK